MKLILVRHGETEENVKKIMQGHTHGKLTQAGIEQAKKVALRLKNEKIDKIYSSDLQRCVDTTKEIIKYHPETKIEYTPELREQKKGIYEGKTVSEMDEDARKAGIHPYEFKPEGGESWPEMTQRMTKFIHKITHEHKTALIISHGGAIRSFLIKLLNVPEEKWNEYKHGNTAVTILEINKNNQKIHTLNCQKHLS